MPGTLENRWVLSSRFVEMTLRTGAADNNWSGVLFIGYERNERRHLKGEYRPAITAAIVPPIRPQPRRFVIA
jgi:hypothetical protein